MIYLHGCEDIAPAMPHGFHRGSLKCDQGLSCTTPDVRREGAPKVRKQANPGNALDFWKKCEPALKGRHRLFRPFRACSISNRYPGRCPGLACLRAFGPPPLRPHKVQDSSRGFPPFQARLPLPSIFQRSTFSARTSRSRRTRRRGKPATRARRSPNHLHPTAGRHPANAEMPHPTVGRHPANAEMPHPTVGRHPTNAEMPHPING